MSDNLPKSPEQKTLRQEDEKSSSWWHISDSLLARMYQFINLIFPVHQEEPKPAIPDNILLSSAPKRSLQNDKIAKEHGIQKTWHTASGESITVTDKEWEIAKAIAKKLENTETLPFKISHNVWGQEYPELHHSFIVMKNGDTFRVGAIARARPYRNMQGDTITEGVLGYGKSGVVKTILWEDGSSDVVKIDAKTHKEDPLKALEKLGKLIGEFSRNRAEKTPWLRGKEGVIQSIQDKHYTILKKENGQNLRAILKNNNFDLIQKQALALEMAKAVQSVHAQDVIHGDIHPGNILVDTHLSNAMSLIDFDRAISLTSGENHRVFGQAKGSRSYMAPEIGIWRPRWKQEGDRWVKAGGYWQFQGGDYSKASDIFALGVVMERDLGLGALGTNWQSFIKRMKSTNPVQRPTAQEMFEFIKDPSHDLNEQNAAQGRARPDPEKREIITPGQALLLLIAKYRSSDTVLAEKLKSLYLTGIRTKDENEFVEKMIEDPVLKKYQISSDPRLIANDASRRYFETHLSLETMKTRLSQLPLPLLKAHYDSIKAQFESLGGDCDQERFLQTGEKVLVRDYETEHNLRIQEGKDPEDIIKGVSAKAQAQLDKIFSGKYQESDDDMTKEYADLVSRIKNNKRLSNEEKEKGLLIIKSTRLGMVLSKNIQKYKKLGCYQGEDLPLEDIYHSNLYQEENRGRLAKDDTNRLAANHHNMGLLKGYHPLPVTDEAYSEEAYRYYKPADRSTFIDGSPWVEEGMAQKVHSYANSISGTMLVQLRTMLKLHQEGKLVLKNKEQFNNTLSAMMGIMVGISGGHSLLEFSAPIKIDKFQEGFSGIDGFDQIDLKTLFFENNETAFEAALAKTIDYNAMEMKKKEIHQDILALANPKADENTGCYGQGCVPEIPKKSFNQVLNQYILAKQNRGVFAAQHPVQPDQYSYLRPQNVYQTPELLSILCQASKESPIDLVSFKPERALLHEVASTLTASIQVSGDEKARNEIILKIVKDLTPKVRTQLSDLYATVRSKVEGEMKLAKKGCIITEVEILKAISQAKKVQLPQEACPELDSKGLAKELAVSALYKKHLQKKMEKIVKDYFANNPNFVPKAIKTTPPTLMFVAGGAASGKGEMVSNLISEEFFTGGCSEKESIVYLNNDSYKPLLQSCETDPKYFSQLTHDEAKLIRDRIFEKAFSQNQDVILDQITISRSGTNKMLKKGGKVHGVVVSVDPKVALLRAQKRGEETGRYENTGGLLEGHQKSPQIALEYLLKNIGKNIRVDFVDTNVQKGTQAIPFMQADLLQKRIQVQDEDLLKEFLKKQFVDVKAISYENIFPNDIDYSEELDSLLASFKEALLAKGFSFVGLNPSRRIAI